MTSARLIPSVLPSSSIASLKTWQLKYWSFLTGLPTSGTKADLTQSIRRHIEPYAHSESQLSKNRASRILSVDMGIRNLAFCVIEAPSLHERLTSHPCKLRVISWIRMDLLDQPFVPESATSTPSAEHETGEGTPQTHRRSKRQRASSIEKGAFGPSSLSRTAYRVTCKLLKHNPDTILIERQRFRSGGAAAIQEWTVRVNMLESMLWACLETIRAQRQQIGETYPDLLEMSPSRVAKFWMAGPELPLSLQQSTSGDDDSQSITPPTVEISKQGKVGKAEKVSLVRSWVTGQSSDEILLEFEDGAEQIAEAFRMGKSKSKLATDMAGGKLDDLADCLLQGVTWIRWEENRHRIGAIYAETTKA